MPRPQKCRRICSIPQNIGFEPIAGNKVNHNFVKMTVDEYEVIRLIDFEKLTQEQCAMQMVVSRTTITSIYGSARYKIADALINGKKLVIDGGEFKLCEHNRKCCKKGFRQNCFDEEKIMENYMKENEKYENCSNI